MPNAHLQVSEMSAEEIRSTKEYVRGAKAFGSKLPIDHSSYDTRRQNLLFKVGWMDADLIRKGTIFAPSHNKGASFLDGRTRT